jgi:selenocysteine lyase/cysteine desulfurase
MTGGPAAFRARFPMLTHTTYLASCSLGARSSQLDVAMARMLDTMTGVAPWPAFEEQSTLARRRFAALVGARADQIAIVPNASVGAYQVASCLDWARRPGVVTSTAEFPSVAHVWLAQRRRGAVVTYAGAPTAADYLAAVDRRTALVSVPMVTYRDGVLPPLAEITAAAHAAGARVFVDAYQAVGVLPVDVAELDCDFLVAGASKYLLGLPGVAFLYVRSAGSTDLDPSLTGWFGRVDPFAFDPRGLTFPERASRFETGTPAVPALYAANAGMELVGALDPRAVRAHVSALTDRACRLLREQGESVRTPDDPAARGAHIAVRDADPAALAGWLAGRGTVVSPRGDVVRLAFHHYNSVEDVDEACAQLRAYRGRRVPVGAAC